MFQSNPLLEKIQNKIDKAEVISFDIFDTLLVRPYVKPTDLFLHMEQIYSCNGYADARITAEVNARKKHSEKEDITLDDIYNELEEKYQSLKQKEIDFEKQVLQPHPQMKDVFDYAKNQNKKIIITSDMYLPKEFLENTLKEKGYTNWEKFYLSCDIKKTKHSGSLYKHIINDLNISPNKILHIGDNEHADIKMAEKNLLKTFHVKKLICLLYENQPAFKTYYNTNPTVQKSVILSLMSHNLISKSYWHSLGYNYAGPTILAYVQWIDSQAIRDKIKHLLFIGRDGYILQKIYNKIGISKLDSSYFFAPRFIKKENKLEFCEYKKYFNTFKFPKTNVAMIDSITRNFSSQLLLKNFLNNILGYYWVINPITDFKIDKNDVREFRLKNFPFMKEWGLMELFMTAPHPSVAGFKNGNPIFNKEHGYEKERIKIYKEIEKGIEDFIDQFLIFFQKNNIDIKENDIRELIDILPTNPTKQDKKYLSKIKHASDIYNKTYEPLMSYWKYEKIKIKFGKIVLFKSKAKKQKRKYYLLGIHIFSRKIK